MDESKFDLGLSQNSNVRKNSVVKGIPSKFITSDISWNFETSEGDRPAEPFMPNRYAPIVRQIRNVSLFEKAIVIPVGSIISAVPIFNKEYYSGSPTDVDGFGIASGDIDSGNIALGIGYDGNVNQAPIDDVFDGYDRIRIVGTIANGGEAAVDKYTQYDVDRGRVGIDGALVAVDDTFNRSANIPIGFTTEDIWLFDNGGKLNYTEMKWNKFSSFATDYFIEMPYYAGANFTDGSTYGTGAGTASAAYIAARALGMPFFWTKTFADLKIGSFVQSDMFGKWRVQYAAGSAVNGNKTAQTVGKLVSFTNKFPEDLQQYVETWNTTRTGGTATYGLEYKLFVFVTTVLTAINGSAPTYAQIKTAMNSGAFGMARINVHVC